MTARRIFGATGRLLLAIVVFLAFAVPARAGDSRAGQPKILLVVAHPDDEYTFAATVYRVAKELGGTVDEVVITDGAGGFHYSTLSEPIYGIPLTQAGRAA